MEFNIFWLIFCRNILSFCFAQKQAECRDPLGMQSGEIPDSAITASSSYDYSMVGPQHARLHTETGGGAWCPKSVINNSSYEYLEVGLNKMSVVTMVEIQGRFMNGQGQEFTEEFRLEYQREDDVEWRRFKNETGEELLRGNVNTYLAELRQVSPPIIGRRIRFIPYSRKPNVVCMRVEIYGCQWEGELHDLLHRCPEGSFGYKCRFRCHCVDDEPCNKITGTCYAGCRSGYWGPGCQLSDNCFYNGQARHYQGRVSVTSNLYICQRWDVQTPHRHSYNENDFPDDTISNIFCRTTKDSSRPWCYTTDRKQRWERCSVNSCRCPAGFYGADCRKNCSANCAEKERSGAPICKFSDGSCNFCDNGWYGDRCDVLCNTNCLMSGGVHACHQQDGTCESCKGNKYGPSCNIDCAQNCLDCEKADGHCLSCQPGYHDNFCDGKCNEHCGTEDDNDVKVGLCDRNTSVCLHGCTNGWYNNTCLDKCNSKCRGEKCNIDNGKCSDGCVSGYRGDFCDLPANGVTAVGFTATFGSERHLVNIGESEIIVFDSVTSNVGFGYNMATGIFRAPVSGVYVFNVGIVVGPLKLADLLIIQAPESGSTKVDRGHVLADSSNVNKRSMGSRTIVLNLSLGDQVWVRNGLSATIELHGNGLSSFSGYLLGPISP